MSNFRGDIYSQSLQMMTGIQLILPDEIEHKDANLLYLFHGYSDNYTSWVRYTSLERYANKAQCAVVIPEVQHSFYMDQKYGMKYFSYVSQELPTQMKKLFGFSGDREKTYVAGLSMGGYGALKCALTYPQNYKAAAAFSAVCDLPLHAAKEQEQKGQMYLDLISSLGADLTVEEENDLFALSEKGTPSESPRILMTCGTEDILLPESRKLAEHLKSKEYPLTYKEWEGLHDWKFWDTSIQMAFDFFCGLSPQAEVTG